MVQFDNQYKQVKLKVVYYGPALGGKTTCLQHIHRVTDPQRRTKLYALATASDRTLFFDLLGIDLGRVRGYRLTLQLYTVPGQVQYNATRRAVLAGVDGVLFVADSQSSQEKANAESLGNLIENLKGNGLDPDSIPIVFQYNKRDLTGLLTRQQLDKALNPRGQSAFESVATAGEGVMEAFAAVTEATVLSVADRLGLGSKSDALARLLSSVRGALRPFVSTGGEVEAPVVIRPDSRAATLSGDELVAEAVRANVAMTDLNVRLDQLSRDLDRRVRQLRSVNEFGRLMSTAREPNEVIGGLLDRLLSELSVGCGTLLLCDQDGELVEALRRGLAADPLSRPSPDGRCPAAVVLETRQPLVVHVDETGPVTTRWAEELLGLGLAAALAVPLIAQDRPVGVLMAYADSTHGPFTEEDKDIAQALVGNAAVALANARAWISIEALNRSLESTVAERTRDLESALAQAQALAKQLDERRAELEAANAQLRDLERLKSELLSRIAHELNTPVTSIQTAARILARSEDTPPEKAAKLVEIITNEAGRLADLIASALQAVVLGVSEGKPKMEQVVIADLLKRAIAPLRGQIAERKLAFQVKVAQGLEHLPGDGGQLETALRAVVKNAVEFNRDEGNIVVMIRPVRRADRSFVEFQVADSGRGIRSEDLPHVTEVFWQGGEVLTGKPGGLGLGLAVARRVAENHGGMLDIVSEADRGTTVNLLFPTDGGGPV